MNKKQIMVFAVLSTALLSLSTINLVEGEGWFEKKAEPKQDVWQESCNPIVILKDGMSCQQANYIIKQNAEIISLMKKLKTI